MARTLGASLLTALLVLGCAQLPAGGSVEPSSMGPSSSEPSASPAAATPPASPTPGGSVPASASLPEATVTPPSPIAPFASSEARPSLHLTLSVVTVKALNVRVAPSPTARLLDAFGLTNPLPKGTRVLVLGDAVKAGGYLWYPVAPSTDRVLEPPVGWVAAGTSSEDWLRPDTTPCPEPTIVTLLGLSDVQHLACYGSSSIAFVARQVTLPPDAGLGGACELRTSAQPRWLICDNVPDNLVSLDGVWEASGDVPPVFLRLFFDPATGIPPTGLAPAGTTGSTFRIQGHFGDPAATQCAAGATKGTLLYLGDWLHCARQFVVEALEVVS